MCILALVAIPTEAGVRPVLAHFSFVHGALDERLHVRWVELDLLELRAVIMTAGAARVLF